MNVWRKDVLMWVTCLLGPIVHLFFSYFIFLSTHSIGRLRADRCLPGGIGAPEVCPSGGLLYLLLFVYSIQCPHCFIKSSSSISLCNARSLTVSLLSLRPSIPFKLDPALRLVTLFVHLKTRWLRALFGRNPV